jgi:hydrogenase maturation factor HypE
MLHSNVPCKEVPFLAAFGYTAKLLVANIDGMSSICSCFPDFAGFILREIILEDFEVKKWIGSSSVLHIVPLCSTLLFVFSGTS